jgi:hypothetical protein
MKRLLLALCATLPMLSLGACYDDGYYGVGYAGGPYGYDGYYDDYYGPVYDGYWGVDGYFYYRGNDHDRHFHRGDGSHFRHDQGGAGNFHPMHGALNPGSGMHLHNFGGNAPGGGHGDHGGRGGH